MSKGPSCTLREIGDWPFESREASRDSREWAWDADQESDSGDCAGKNWREIHIRKMLVWRGVGWTCYDQEFEHHTEDKEQGESSKGPSCYFDPQSQNLKEKVIWLVFPGLWLEHKTSREFLDHSREHVRFTVMDRSHTGHTQRVNRNEEPSVSEMISVEPVLVHPCLSIN